MKTLNTVNAANTANATTTNNKSIIGKAQKGFTLIELMVTIGIVAVLAAVAAPMYDAHAQKAKFSNVAAAAEPAKAAVSLAIQNGNAPAVINGGANGIENLLLVNEYVASVATVTGVITATAEGQLGGATYTLTPTVENGMLVWTVGGTCVSKDWC